MPSFISLHTDAPRDAVFLCDLRQTQPGAAVLDDLLPVDIEPRTTNLPTLKFCPSHSTFDTVHHE
jgi:hypothetical protein